MLALPESIPHVERPASGDQPWHPRPAQALPRERAMDQGRVESLLRCGGPTHEEPHQQHPQPAPWPEAEPSRGALPCASVYLFLHDRQPRARPDRARARLAAVEHARPARAIARAVRAGEAALAAAAWAARARAVRLGTADPRRGAACAAGSAPRARGRARCNRGPRRHGAAQGALRRRRLDLLAMGDAKAPARSSATRAPTTASRPRRSYTRGYTQALPPRARGSRGRRPPAAQAAGARGRRAASPSCATVRTRWLTVHRVERGAASSSVDRRAAQHLRQRHAARCPRSGASSGGPRRCGSRARSRAGVVAVHAATLRMRRRRS